MARDVVSHLCSSVRPRRTSQRGGISLFNIKSLRDISERLTGVIRWLHCMLVRCARLRRAGTIFFRILYSSTMDIILFGIIRMAGS